MAYGTPLSANSAATVDSTGGNIFDKNGGVKSAIWIGVDAASANPALINIPGLHVAGEFIPLAIGQGLPFALGIGELETAFAKGDGGDATMSWGIISTR